jgi:cytochrome oxidase assembly protein ShyY1
LNLQTIRRWAPWLALVVLFAIATTLLSWWQFSRREERVEKINQVIENYEAEAIDLAETL